MSDSACGDYLSRREQAARERVQKLRYETTVKLRRRRQAINRIRRAAFLTLGTAAAVGVAELVLGVGLQLP